MKSFKIISKSLCAIQRSGYRFDKLTQPQTDFGGNMPKKTRERLLQEFRELDYVTLCDDENGQLYAVLFDWSTMKPLIWQRLIK